MDIANRRSSGSAVALYGSVGPTNARSFSVQVDSDPPTTFSAKQNFHRSQQILFHVGGLQSGQHSLIVQLQPGGGEFAIDYAAVYSTVSLGGR